jgi:hypothetical protein
MRSSTKALGAMGLVVGALGCDRSADGGTTGAASATVAVSAPSVTRATITLDDQHDVMKGGVGYVITPATELSIELSANPFPAANKVPDVVHVAHGSSEYYRAGWAGGTRITLNAASLDPVKGGPFPGFTRGDDYVIAVGSEAPSPEGVLRFAPVWSTKITVR